jgi:hypothetical protein
MNAGEVSVGHEAEALDGISAKAEELTARGWTRHLVEDGELVEDS